jgi:hypothetical protein
MADTAENDLETEQFDIATAFLNGHLTDEKYLTQLEGFAILDR